MKEIIFIFICILFLINITYANNLYDKKSNIVNDNLDSCIKKINIDELNNYKNENWSYELEWIDWIQKLDTDYSNLCWNVIVGKISSNIEKSVDGNYYFTTSNNSYFRFDRRDKVIWFSW